MGVDKARLRIDGVTSADRLAYLLTLVTDPVIEVGPAHSDLTAVLEEPRGGGPLVAIAAGRTALLRAGHCGPAIVLACDLPFIGVDLVKLLASWPGTSSVVPVVDGHEQPLCARWSKQDLDAAAVLTKSGERSLRQLPNRVTATLLDEYAWRGAATARTFSDIDTPADLVTLGISERVELPQTGIESDTSL